MVVIRGIGMMPFADDAGGNNQSHDQRQRNPEYTNRLPSGSKLADKGWSMTIVRIVNTLARREG
jgi:hypothetical protein